LNLARVDCLESILLALIDQLGFESINSKVSRGMVSGLALGMRPDTALQASFGAKKSEANSREMLAHYLADVRSDAQFLPGV
jgi:hypothetical protein